MHLVGMSDPEQLMAFKDAPIIVGRKDIRDAINARRVFHHATELGEKVHLYYSRDYVARKPVSAERQSTLWSLTPGVCDDTCGRLPLFVGMKVMISENIAFTHRAVNGAEGIVHSIEYEEDESGRRFAKIVYVRIPGAGQVCDDLERDIVPVIPQRQSFKVGRSPSYNVSREQVPLMPAYSYTDYKSQGRSLERAIIDIQSAGRSQGIYVMLSRVKSLQGLLILRPFEATKFPKDVSRDYKEELQRIDKMDQMTMQRQL